MKQIPVFFDTVHRSALIITPKKSFKEWLISMDPDDANIDLSNETDLYLIPNFDDHYQAEQWLKENFDIIFCDQMNNWYIDESDWEQNRTFKTFKEWFNYSIHLQILDTLEIPIKKSI
ncbi:MAG TPA: hypothetical protein PLY32_00720 [Salinivirgaceae bacterium]|nr:hypothetical protein [Salinivirgaceae bacterium]